LYAENRRHHLWSVLRGPLGIIVVVCPTLGWAACRVSRHGNVMALMVWALRAAFTRPNQSEGYFFFPNRVAARNPASLPTDSQKQQCHEKWVKTNMRCAESKTGMGSRPHTGHVLSTPPSRGKLGRVEETASGDGLLGYGLVVVRGKPELLGIFFSS